MTVVLPDSCLVSFFRKSFVRCVCVKNIFKRNGWTLLAFYGRLWSDGNIHTNAPLRWSKTGRDTILNALLQRILNPLLLVLFPIVYLDCTLSTWKQKEMEHPGSVLFVSFLLSARSES